MLQMKNYIGTRNERSYGRSSKGTLVVVTIICPQTFECSYDYYCCGIGVWGKVGYIALPTGLHGDVTILASW